MSEVDELRKLILASAADAAMDLLYYNRKEDEELPRGAIEDALENGVVTVDDIVEQFRIKFVAWLP